MKKWMLLLCFVACTANAMRIKLDSDTLGEKLSGFFDSLGFSSNLTDAGAYHSQAGGFYTGGSLVARSSVKTVRPVTVQLPHARSGCSGIDIFTGGVSFINSEELVNAGKNILNNSAGYAFHLALETLCPVCANSYKYFQTMANTINQGNINSCETAEALVGGLWPKTKAANKLICQDLAQNESQAADWASARQSCGNGGNANDTLEKAKKNEEYKASVLYNTNIAWEALKKNPAFSDAEIKELMMSLSGTFVVRTKGGKKDDDQGTSDDRGNQIVFFPALADDDAVFKALLEGGTDATLYTCAEETKEDGLCLYPQKNKKQVEISESVIGKVRKMLDSMLKKIKDDQALTDEEIKFLNSVKLPVYKMLNIQAAFSVEHTALNVQKYAEFIATELLFSYLNNSLREVLRNSSALQNNQVEQFRQNIRHTMARLDARRQNAYQSAVLAQRMTQEVMQLEAVLSSQLSSRISTSLGWSEGLF